MIIVATTSLPAVDLPIADHWNAARSCQYLWRVKVCIPQGISRGEAFTSAFYFLYLTFISILWAISGVWKLKTEGFTSTLMQAGTFKHTLILLYLLKVLTQEIGKYWSTFSLGLTLPAYWTVLMAGRQAGMIIVVFLIFCFISDLC